MTNKLEPERSGYLDTAILGGFIEAQSWDHELSEQDVNVSCDLFFSIFDSLKNHSVQNKRPTTRLKKIKFWIAIDLIRD